VNNLNPQESWPAGNLGKSYAYGLNVWSQLAVFLSIGNSVGVGALVYKNFFLSWLPLWAFILAALAGLGLLVVFIVKIGIQAYYELTRRLTGIDRIEGAVNHEEQPK